MSITRNRAVTLAGELEFSRAMFTRAMRHAWAAGDIDDVAVHELTQLALAGEAIARHAISPADVRLAGRNLVNLLAPAAGCRPCHQLPRRTGA